MSLDCLELDPFENWGHSLIYKRGNLKSKVLKLGAFLKDKTHLTNRHTESGHSFHWKDIDYDRVENTSHFGNLA